MSAGRLCPPCQSLADRWIDAFTDWGPMRGWRQYRADAAAQYRMSAEVRAMYVNDRADLIRRQLTLIRTICARNHVA